VDSPAGVLPALVPTGMAPSEPRLDAIPALGQHTEAILAELGLSGDDVARLRSDGAI
jgi:itaconate CoA-transferase